MAPGICPRWYSSKLRLSIKTAFCSAQAASASGNEIKTTCGKSSFKIKACRNSPARNLLMRPGWLTRPPTRDSPKIKPSPTHVSLSAKIFFKPIETLGQLPPVFLEAQAQYFYSFYQVLFFKDVGNSHFILTSPR